MQGKDIIINFFTAIFFLLIMAFATFSSVMWMYFDNLVEILQNISPFMIFGVGLLIVLRMDIKRYKIKREEGDLDIELNLTYMDKIKTNFIMFGLPLVLCIIPLIFQGSINIFNIFQSLVAFFVILLFRNSLFQKGED